MLVGDLQVLQEIYFQAMREDQINKLLFCDLFILIIITIIGEGSLCAVLNSESHYIAAGPACLEEPVFIV